MTTLGGVSGESQLISLTELHHFGHLCPGVAFEETLLATSQHLNSIQCKVSQEGLKDKSSQKATVKFHSWMSSLCMVEHRSGKIGPDDVSHLKY